MGVFLFFFPRVKREMVGGKKEGRKKDKCVERSDERREERRNEREEEMGFARKLGEIQ